MSPQAKRFAVVESLSDIPEFGSEAEEHAFWASHEFSDELSKNAEPLAPDELPPPTVPVVIRLDEATVRRVKTLARRRGTGYRALLKELVAAGLDNQD